MNQITIKLCSILAIINFTTLSYASSLSYKSYIAQPFLIEALQLNNLDQVKQAIQYGALLKNLDQNLQTALHLAAFYNTSPEILEYLIDQGIDVNDLDRLRQTALHEIVRHNNPAAIQVLLEAQANVNAFDFKGNSPLHLVKDGKIAQLLINAQADINAQNIDGETPLMLAIRKGYKTVVQTLLQNNADLYLKNIRNQTVFDLINNPTLLCQYRQQDVTDQDCNDIVYIFHQHLYNTSPFTKPVKKMKKIIHRKDESAVNQYLKHGLQ